MSKILQQPSAISFSLKFALQVVTLASRKKKMPTEPQEFVSLRTNSCVKLKSHKVKKALNVSTE